MDAENIEGDHPVRLATPSGLGLGLRGLLLFIVPAVALLVVGVRLAAPVNHIDEFIYIGTVERLSDFLARWPDTYYAYRFGYIIPEFLAERLLGPDLGFLALRFGLLGAIPVLLFRRGSVSPFIAGVGGLIVALSPIVVRGMFDTYVDSLAVGFLLVGALLLADLGRESRHCLLTAFAAGVALSLALHANFGLILIVAVLGLVFSVDGLFDPENRQGLAWRPVAVGQLALSLSVVGGLLAVAATGSALYWYRYGIWNVWHTSIRQAQAEPADVFMDTNALWFTWRHYLLVAPISWLIGAIVLRVGTDERFDRSIRRLLAGAILSFGVFAYLQWVADQPALSTYYYSVFPLALGVLLIAQAAVAVLSEVHATDVRATSLRCFGFVSVPFVLAWFLAMVNPPYLLVVAVTIGVGVVALRIKTERLVAAAGLLVIAGAGVTVTSPDDFESTSPDFRTDPSYEHAFFSYSRDGLDVNAVTREFVQTIPSLPEERGEVFVWFDGAGITSEVLSGMVHYRSALQGVGDPMLPEVSDTVVDRLTNRRPRFVVLLGDERASVDVGLQRLGELPGEYSVNIDRQITRGQFSVFLVVLERAEGTWADYPCTTIDQWSQDLCL